MAGEDAAVEALSERVARLDLLLSSTSIDTSASVAVRLENVAANVDLSLKVTESPGRFDRSVFPQIWGLESKSELLLA